MFALAFTLPLGSCPHTRGGEPCSDRALLRAVDIVPTRVGVNRSHAEIETIAASVVPTRVGVNRMPRRTAIATAPIVPTRVGVNRMIGLDRISHY